MAQSSTNASTATDASLSAPFTSLTVDSVTGASGRVYRIGKTLQDKDRPLTKVYRASDSNNQFVLKEISQECDIRLGIYKRAGNCPYLRNLVDTIPERMMFVFDYLEDNLLRLARQEVPQSVMKYILKCVLQGLAVLHAKDIIHNDVKANNVMVQFSSRAPEWSVNKVQLVDLEDAAHAPAPGALEGAWVGNIMWRSPEAHAMGPVRKPSDMFSYGLVCLYAMTQILPFAVDREFLPQGVEPLAVILERQISYFAEADDFDAFLKYLGDDSPWVQMFNITLNGFIDEGKAREPFRLWGGLKIDQADSFRRLIIGLTRFDPDKRLTAEQALEHEWFRDVEVP